MLKYTKGSDTLGEPGSCFEKKEESTQQDIDNLSVFVTDSLFSFILHEQ